MKCNGAERAGARAAPVVGNGEAHLLNCGHTAQAVVHRVGQTHIGQLRHMVQLRSGQRHGRGIDHQNAVLMALQDRPAPDRVVLIVLHFVGLGIGSLVLPHSLEGIHLYKGVGALCFLPRRKGASLYVPDLADGNALFEPSGDLQRGALAHAVNQQIRLRVKQDTAAHLVLPVVIVGKPAQGRFQPADDNRNITKRLPDFIGIDDGRPIRPQTGLSSRGVKILTAPFFRRCIVGHHGVQITTGDKYPQLWLTKLNQIVDRPPVGLGQHTHPESRVLQHPGDHRRTKSGVIHISVRCDKQDVIPVPIPIQHLLLVHRQKLPELFPFCHGSPLLSFHGYCIRFHVFPQHYSAFRHAECGVKSLR